MQTTTTTTTTRLLLRLRQISRSSSSFTARAGHGSLPPRPAGTVKLYHRHLLLSYQAPPRWPPQFETSELDPLPRSLADSLLRTRTSSPSPPKKTLLTIYEATDSDGEVLIFPDMIKYKGLTVSNIEGFVEDVVIKERDWSLASPKSLHGSYVFVCAHGTRDLRCGTCGPPIIDAFNKEIRKQSLEKDILVRACSHVGGHKYAGNVIIYSSDIFGKNMGHWYGYVTPDYVNALLDEHIGKRKIINELWRGQMGLNETEQKKACQTRLGGTTSLEETRS